MYLSFVMLVGELSFIKYMYVHTSALLLLLIDGTGFVTDHSLVLILILIVGLDPQQPKAMWWVIIHNPYQQRAQN